MRLHVRYKVEAGIACARIVDADLVILAFVMLDNLLEAAQVHNRFALGDFKNNIFGADGKAGQVFLGEAHAKMGILNNVGIYIKKQADARWHLAGGAQGATPEEMLKLQHAPIFQRALNKGLWTFKRSSGRAAAKRFITKNSAIAKRNNGLEHAGDGLILEHIQQGLTTLIIIGSCMRAAEPWT